MSAVCRAVQAALCRTLLLLVLQHHSYLLLLPVAQVEASGVFELYLKSFRNDQGLNADGQCCNDQSSEGQCTSSCHTFFHVCLTHYQRDIATKADPGCTFGEYSSKVVAYNSANFSASGSGGGGATASGGSSSSSSSSDLPSVDSPIKFPISEFSWPGDFSLIIEAWHDTTLTGPSSSPDSPRELICRLAVQRSATAGRDYYNSNYSTSYSELLYSYRFVCDQSYYGPACGVLCRARDDHFGHNYCTDNGTKVCLDGWKGEYCDEAICLSGCHPSHGYCDDPNECKCQVGWEGEFCDQCKPHPECQHGTCQVPNTCNCLEGWGGQLCNQDLNFCTHHAPCQNGGTCTNTGQGSYTCRCPPGYSGRNCEDTIDHCLDQPCLNAATCQTTETGFTCICPANFYGTLCGQEANFCRTETCHNGGTCVDHQGSYQCLCPQGYAGFHCETDTGGCKQDSCKNGGTCVGRECICPVGFYGPTCTDDGHDDCQRQPCLNGGTCSDLTNDFECRCVAGFVGPTCQVNVDDCEMRPCANGGSCTDLVNDFRCTCMPGWTGKDCSFNEDDCLSRPCQHGGRCQDLIDDYRCECRQGFWGKDCQMYEGMTTSTTTTTTGNGSPSPVNPASPNVTQPPGSVSTDKDNHSGNISGIAGSRGEGEDRELLLGVCLGVGIPILLLIVCVALLLCRKRALRHRRCRRARGTDDDYDGMDKERQQNYINNINANSGGKASNLRDLPGKRIDDDIDDDDDEEACCDGGRGRGVGATAGIPRAIAEQDDSKLDGGGKASPIFTTSSGGLHSAAVMMAAAPSGVSASASAAAVAYKVVKVSNVEQEDINRLNSQQHRGASGGKTAAKHFLRDKLPPPKAAVAAHPTVPLPTLPHRDCRVHDVEKPVRRLEVDPASGDTQVDISTYRRHAGDISILCKPGLMAPVADRGSPVRRSVYLEPLQQPCPPRYTDDYLATEV